jgi:predicted glycosyltransferase
VPLSYERTLQWSNLIFAKGLKHLKDMIIIGVSDADADLETLKGSWRQVSPEELSHSLIFYLANLMIGNTATEEDLIRYRSILLSTPVMFQVLEGEDSVYWEAYDQRQRTWVH